MRNVSCLSMAAAIQPLFPFPAFPPSHLTSPHTPTPQPPARRHHSSRLWYVSRHCRASPSLTHSFFSLSFSLSLSLSLSLSQTGPVTVPLVISLGLGVGKGVGAADGFGILSLASVCPIISVLAVGLLMGGECNRRERDGGQGTERGDGGRGRQ